MKFRPSIPALIISILLCVAVFLPWITADFFGFSASANGTDSYPGIITLVMAILAAILSIFTYYKIASVGVFIAGLAAAGGIAGYWFLEYGNFQSAGINQVASVYPGYGLYIAGGLAIILFIAGLVSLGTARAPIMNAAPYQTPPPSYDVPPQGFNAPPPPPPAANTASA